MPLPPPVADAIREALRGLPVERHDPTRGIPLQVVPFGADEVLEAVEALLSTRLTMGERVATFERAFADWLGSRHAVMVNSGSSANLLAWSALVQSGRLQPGDEVLVPAVAWSTSLFPVLQAGLRAVLVDVHPDTLCMDPEAARRALGPRSRALCAVHLLGCPADLDALSALGLPVVEDACAAHGAEWGGRKVGGIGLLGTFSFFFSHHVTTVEGGMLVTDDDELADLARSLRAHGWVREMSRSGELARQHPEIDPRFLFVTPGYNLRPTELAAAFGLHQLRRLPGYVARRRANHLDWCERVGAAGLPLRCFPEPAGGRHAGFAFALLLDPHRAPPRSRVQAALEERGIATRAISGGNLARQPVAARLHGLRLAEPLAVADAVHHHGFFVGNSHAFGPEHGALLVEALEEALHA